MKKAVLYLFLIITIICMGFICNVYADNESAVRMYCLNIGKADCIILQAYGKNYMIDTGYENNYPAVNTALKELNISKLDAVFLTHTDSDHAGGLLKISLSGIDVNDWYGSKIFYEFSNEKHPLRLAAAIRGKQVSWLSAGDVIRVSEEATIAVLGPVRLSAGNENNNSLVLRFDSPDGSILLTGDMKSEEEATIISSKMLSSVDVLKVGHHGDGNATSAAFVQIIKPKLAVISTSSNEENDTPDRRVLDRLYTAGCKTCVITQDFDDAVLISLDAGKLSVENVIWSSVPARLKCITMQMDAENDRVILYNNSGKEVSLQNSLLYAKQNDKVYKMKDINIPPYSFFIIGSSKTTGTIDYEIPGTKRIWNRNKYDVAILYDAYGRAVAAANNGLTE